MKMIKDKAYKPQQLIHNDKQYYMRVSLNEITPEKAQFLLDLIYREEVPLPPYYALDTLVELTQGKTIKKPTPPIQKQFLTMRPYGIIALLFAILWAITIFSPEPKVYRYQVCDYSSDCVEADSVSMPLTDREAILWVDGKRMKIRSMFDYHVKDRLSK